MADQTKTYGIRITADASDLKEVRAEMDGTAKATQAAGRAAQGAAPGFSAASKEIGAATLSAKQLRLAMQQVPAQFTDIATSLAAGQSPFLVLLQQGGQLKDAFGGIGPAARALGGYVLGLVSPFTLAAGAVGVLTAAYVQGQAEAEAFGRAIILSGNAAGTSVGQLQASAANVAQATGATQGRAAEVLAGLVEGGKVAADQLEAVSSAAIAMERATGKAAEETAKDFERLFKAPVAESLRLNETYRFLTPAIFEQIKALEEQGLTMDAARKATEALSDTTIERANKVKDNLGDLQKVINATGEVFKWMWDQAKGIGREQSIQDELAQAKKDLESATASGDTGEIARLASLVKHRQWAVDAAKEQAKAEAELNRQRELGVNFVANSATAEEKRVAASQKALLDLQTGWAAYVAQKEKDKPGWIDSPEGVAALERYRGKLSEVVTELNKTAIASEGRLKEALTSAMQKGIEDAAKLKEEIAALNAEIGKVASGGGEFAQKAQARRDKGLTPEEADAKNQRAAQDAIDQARSLSVFAQNAAIDGRAEQAQRYAEQAATLMKAAGEASDKIADNDIAAKLFDQLDAVQKQSLEAQKAIKEQQLAEQQAQTAAQNEELAKLEARLAELKSGAVVEVKADTAAALQSVQELDAAAAQPVTKTVTVNYVSAGAVPTGAETASTPDLPARAYGGPLPGYAAHDRADDRLYWGTPGEWVIQRPTVRWYGDDFMRRLNARQIPKYAFGGRIGDTSGAIASRLTGIAIPSVTAAPASGVMEARDLVMPDGSRFPVMTRQDVGAEIEAYLNRARLAVGRR